MRTALLMFLTLVPLYFISAQQQEYKLAQLMGLTLQSPLEFTIAHDGNIYVADGLNIKVFSPDGKLLKEHFIEGGDIATDKQGNFYVTREKYKVCKYNSQGELLMCFGSQGQAIGQNSSARGVDIDSEGNIYVTDPVNRRVQKFDEQGNFLQVFDSLATESGYLIEPYRIKIDRFNRLNIIGNHWFIRLKPDGTPELLISGTFIEDVAYDSEDNIYLSAVPHDGGRYITKYSPDGEKVGTFIDKGTAEGQINTLYTRLAFDSDYNLLILGFTPGTLKNRIYRFSPDFKFISSFGNAGANNDNEIKVTNLMKFDDLGNFYTTDNSKISLFNKNGKHINTFGFAVRGLAIHDQGDVYVIATNEQGVVHRFTSTGKYIASMLKHPLVTDDKYFFPDKIFFDHADNMYLMEGDRCLKYDSNGDLIGDIKFKLKTYPNGNTVTVQDITIDALGFFYIIQDHHLLKYDQKGILVNQFEVLARERTYESRNAAVALDDKGNIYIADKLTIKKFNQTGDLIAYIPSKYPPESNPFHTEFHVKRDGSVIWSAIKDYSQFYNIRVFLSSEFVNMPNQISGTIYDDTNQNCELDENEVGLDGVVVMATPGPYYGKTNRNGRYNIEVSPGNYALTQLLPDLNGKNIQPLCPEAGKSNSVNLSEKEGAAVTLNFANEVTLTPYLTTSVSSTRRRRCFESTTKVTYTNSGFASAENAKVHVQLPEQVELLSADKPYTLLSDGTYVFEVGTVAAGQSSVITIQDKVKCGDESIRGLTVCTKVWITDSKPLPPAATTTITGKCDPETGAVRFVIKNIGQLSMDTGKLFRIYLDGQLATLETYRLAAGDSLVLWIPSGGKTVRLEADQPEGNGDNKMASVTVEACTAKATGETVVSKGFVNALPTDDEEPTTAQECLMIRDSYDPNDKMVSPIGLTEENYTPTGAALKYKIRFQNTGTDVAYRVVVVDTLSENLDLSTLEVGSASHSYRFDVSGKGKPVLTWTFDNIMLPDSTSNEPGSHGFIQFSIKPKADLPEKTAVENFADIFFDFNSPVRTNTTLNRIYDMPPVISDEVRLDAEQIIASPAISGVTPAAGKFGAEVILTGKNFSSTPERNKVYFNGSLATVVSASATELKVLVPANATTGNLKVITPDGGAQGPETFEVYQPPVINSFSPVEGVEGTTVTITGKNLTAEWLQSITLGAETCEIISTSGTTAVIKVPQQDEPGTFTFQIITKGGLASSNDAFMVWHQPAISSLSNYLDKVGASIAINGENFALENVRNIVQFGEIQAQVMQASATRLLVRVPEGATTANVSLETPGGKTTTVKPFEVIPAPVLFSFSPAKGPVGTEVTLVGGNFLVLGTQDTVLLNGEKVQLLTTAPDKFTVRIPRGASTGKVKIAGIGGYALSSSEFVVEELTAEESIEVYPNPSTGEFTISFLHADFDVQLVQVYTSVGRIIHTVPVSTPRPEKLEIDITKAKPGMYLLRIQTDRGLIVKKLNVL